MWPWFTGSMALGKKKTSLTLWDSKARNSSNMKAITAVALVAAVLGLLILGAAAEENFYETLELEKGEDSTEKEIKQQFRKLSKKYHPDRHPEHRDKYVTIQRANEVLSDRRKRKVYDMKGEEGLKQLETQGTNQGHQDPFAALFGGGGQGGANKGQDVRMNLLVTLEDMYNGASHIVAFNKQKLCRHCKGLGAASKADLQPCTKCKGRGVTLQRVQLAPGFVQQVQNTCPKCNGLGKTIKKKCPLCKGQKVTRGDQNLDIEIERGTPENHQLMFDMEADQSPDILPGDVIFTVTSVPHSVFNRRGNTLEMTMTISLVEALVGFKRSFKHLDGRIVEVEQTGVTHFGQKKKIEGEGMPIHNVPSEKGDLIVTFEVDFPRRLSAEQQEAVKKLFGQ